LKRIALAAVAGAHGVKGELRLKLFTDSIDNLKRHQCLHVGGEERRLEGVRAGSSGAIARIAGISTRSEAEALRGSLIEVDRSELPPLEKGEYYHSDLIGLACVASDGSEIGRVQSVENYGAGDLIEIDLGAGKSSLVPFRPGIADLEDGRIIVDPEFLA
jgi:16S rRNA processing protein RimM